MYFQCSEFWKQSSSELKSVKRSKIKNIYRLEKNPASLEKTCREWSRGIFIIERFRNENSKCFEHCINIKTLLKSTCKLEAMSCNLNCDLLANFYARAIISARVHLTSFDPSSLVGLKIRRVVSRGNLNVFSCSQVQCNLDESTQLFAEVSQSVSLCFGNLGSV